MPPFNAIFPNACRVRFSGPAILLLCLTLSPGCGSPSKANIQLRKDNDDLRDQITHLNLQHDADLAKLGVFESHATTRPNLPISRLDKLSTANGIKFGRLTSGTDLDPEKPGDEGVKVEAIIFDADNDPIKAMGSFTIEAFDLADPNPKIGVWEFTPSDARKFFFSTSFLYAFIFDCRWQRIPTHPNVTIKVTYVDELTDRTFTIQKLLTVHLPPATQPASATAAAK